jgi:hypothetical protein
MRPDDLAWSDVGPWPSTGDVSPAARGGSISPPPPRPARKQVRIDGPDSVAVGEARAGQGTLTTPVLDLVDDEPVVRRTNTDGVDTQTAGRAPTDGVLDLVDDQTVVRTTNTDLVDLVADAVGGQAGYGF